MSSERIPADPVVADPAAPEDLPGGGGLVVGGLFRGTDTADAPLFGRRAALDVSADEDPLPLVPPQHQALPAAPAPSVAATVEPAVAAESITCPECGTTAYVVLNRRDADDFCRRCDYPLFWVPSRILMGRVGSEAASLRRLPGTLGRVAVASLECPHCDELNAVTSLFCVRCGGDLHPAPPPVPVAAIEVPEPEPEPVAAPERFPWAWLIIALVVVAAVITVGTLTWFASGSRCVGPDLPSTFAARVCG